MLMAAAVASLRVALVMAAAGAAAVPSGSLRQLLRGRQLLMLKVEQVITFTVIQVA